MKKPFFWLFLLCGSAGLYGQVAVSYEPFRSFVSISSDTEKLVWADLGAETNTFFTNVNLEGSVLVNLKRTDWVNYYTGAGININPFYSLEALPFVNGYTLKAGARVKPLPHNRSVQVFFELSPYFNRYFDGGIFRSSLGLSYNFR